MKDFFKNLPFSLLLGSLVGFVIGIGSVYVDSSVSNVLNSVTDIALIGARSVLGVRVARVMSSPPGLVLLHVLFFSALAVLSLLPLMFLLNLLRSIGFHFPVRDFILWGYSTTCFSLYISVWFHITRFLSYPDTLSVRGFKILFLTLVLTSLFSFLVLLFYRSIRMIVDRKDRRLISRSLAVAAVILIIMLCVLTAESVPTRVRTGFERVDTNLSVVLIGIDAVTTSFIEPLVEQKRLGNLKRIIENGSWGKLRSSIPLKSPVVWTTIATGRTHREHGINDFLVKRPGRAVSISVTSLQRRKPALWNIVSDGSTVGVINWWATWPVESVNGFMLSNRFNAPNVSRRCYPEEITAAVDSICSESDSCDLSRFTDYKPNMIFDPVLSSLRNHTVDDYLWNSLCRVFRKDNLVFDAAGILMRRFSPRLLFVYTHGIDDVQSQFFRYHPVYSSFPFSLFHSQQQDDSMGNVIESYYEFIDSRLADFVDSMDENTVLVIVSDHGAGPLLRQITSLDFNRFFELKGWLRRKVTGEIDLEKTLVFSAGSQPMENTRKIYLGEGIKSDPNSLSRFKESFKEELKSLRTKKGEELVRKFLDDNRAGADFVLEVNKWISGDDSIRINGQERAISDIAIPLIDVLSGEHRINGTIIMMGGPVKKKNRIHGASVFDVAPTVLYLLGYPVSEDMEGRVITEALSEEFVESHPIRSIPTYDDIVEKSYRQPMDREGTDEKMMEKLRALGYIE